MFLANPNNPTGTYIPFDEVKRLHAGLPKNVLLVIDAAYAEYVRRNDYESGIELVATSDNVVMTRTFSKIYGLAGLRLGWLYGPAHVVDALNRIRGPFNVGAPSIAAGVAAIADTAHVERARQHNEKWLAWLTEEITKLGLKVTPSVGNFILIHFPTTKGKTAKDADALLTSRGVVLRAVGAYHLPNALRMSIGTEEANRLRGRDARRTDGEEGVSPIIDRLALIGVGLIGGSIARAAREYGAARTIVATARSEATRKRVVELGIADQVVETNAEAVEGRRPRHRLHSGRRERAGRGRDCRSSEARRDRVRCRLGQGPGAQGHGAAYSEGRASDPGASGRRHGEFRSGLGLSRAVRQPLVHPDAAPKARMLRPSRSSRPSGARSAPTSRS